MDVMARRRAIMAHIAKLVKKIISSVTGLVSFKTNVEMPTKVTCEFSPIQEGTGDPSPDNVRSISGWTGVNINHCKKNLLPSKTDTLFWDTNGYIHRAGHIVQSNSYLACSKYFPAIAGSYYTFYVEGTWRGIAFYDKDKVALTLSEKTSTVTIQAPNNAAYYRVYIHASCNNAQLEVSDTATAYEPYQGKTVPINRKLPDEYQEVEYLEANKKQYFWADIPIQDGLTVDAVQSFNAGDTFLFGGHADESNQNRSAFNGMYAGKIQGSYPKSYYNVGSGLEGGNRAVYHVVTTHSGGNRTVYVDNVLVSSASGANTVTETGAPCCVFANRALKAVGEDEANLTYAYSGRVYSLKVSKENVLLADYIPCYRKADSKPGMYDLVTGTFYVNQGTGDDFTVGPDASTLPGTVYGGTVTLNEDGSANLVVSIGYAEITGGVNKGTNSKYYSDDTTYGYTSIGFAYDNTTGYTIDGAYSNWLRSYDGAVWNHTEQHNIYGAHVKPSTGNIALRVDNSVIGATVEDTTNERVEKFNTYLSAHPLQICAKLATPQTYHFDNIGQLNSFLGENNIWHDMNGSITAEYLNKQ